MILNAKLLKRKYRYSLVLLRELVITDFKLRYQGSVLGYLWSFLRPLFLFLIMYFVFVYFLKIGDRAPYWPVAMLIGVVLWNFFTEITKGGLKCIVYRGGLIRKINFPKYTIPVSGVLSALINFVFNLIVIMIFVLINHVPFSLGMLMLPVYVMEIALLALGLSFILSLVYVKFRDIEHIWEIIMQGLFYASVIIYPASNIIKFSSDIGRILLMNPVAQAINDARHFFVSSEYSMVYTFNNNNLALSLVPFIFTLIILIVGAYLFKKKSPSFAENV